MIGSGIKILLILTSQATMGDDPRPTGMWFEELSTPYYAFIDAGAGGGYRLHLRQQNPGRSSLNRS